jgi:Fe-S-cluster containining protein
MTGRIDVEGVPECVDCGRCCFSYAVDYIRVFGVDHARMDDHARAYTSFDGHRCQMRMVDGHCAALQIDPVARRFTCAIYPMRPDVCRSLERGSGACRADRHEKAERPLLAIERLLRDR